MKFTKTLTIVILLLFLPITNASTCTKKTENSFLNESIEENNQLLFNGYYFIIGRVNNVDRGPHGGYNHCWFFHIIKAFVISEKIPRIRIYENIDVSTTYEGFLGFLGDNFVCAYLMLYYSNWIKGEFEQLEKLDNKFSTNVYARIINCT